MAKRKKQSETTHEVSLITLVDKSSPVSEAIVRFGLISNSHLLRIDK